MKSLRSFHLRLVSGLAVLVIGQVLVERSRAQDAAPAAAEQSSVVTPELEVKFIATLTNATLKGRWTGIKDGQLGPEKEDTYQIVSVTKIGGDRWTISARLSYGGKSLVLPLPALVKWAGDTPVLVIDKLSLGFGPTYSARVLIYEKTYAGTWSGGDHGGLLSGLITDAAN